VSSRLFIARLSPEAFMFFPWRREEKDKEVRNREKIETQQLEGG
jgi:hypothetical protein